MTKIYSLKGKSLIYKNICIHIIHLHISEAKKIYMYIFTKIKYILRVVYIYIYILSLLVYLRDLFSRDISRREFSRQKISKIISI